MTQAARAVLFPPWVGAVVFVAALAVSIPLHAVLGMDSAWDTANYHMYNGWATAHMYFYGPGAVAQYRTYFNPVLDLFNYLAFSSSAWAGAALHSIVFAVDAWLVFLLATHLCSGRAYPRVSVGVAVAVGLTGAMTISLFGTWTNEHQTAIFVLLGLLLLLRHAESHVPLRLLLAGVCFGAAAGLKLTAASYGLGALAVAAAGGGPRWGVVSRFSAGALLGFLLVDGPFMFLRWQATGNPVFPFFNNLFMSPDFPFVWNPETWSQIGNPDPTRFVRQLGLPFTWLVDGATSEAPTVRDGRFLLGYMGLALGAFGIFTGRQAGRAQRMFLLFFAVSFVAWVFVFHTYRHVLALELMTGLAFVVGCQVVFLQARPGVVGAALVAVALFLGVVTVYPNWGRRPWSNEFASSNLASLAEIRGATTIYFADQRLSYLSPQLHAQGKLFANLFSQTWWDGPRRITVQDNDSTVETRTTIPDPSGRIAFLQYSTLDLRQRSPYLAARFRGATFSCVPVQTNMIWNPYLCFFGSPG